VVGFLAGAPLQVSGPAAGLTVVCSEAIRQHGLAAFGLIVLVAGLIQVAAGLCRLGMWFPCLGGCMKNRTKSSAA
jgi:MFS superfamily sulfate permease-like transporter